MTHLPPRQQGLPLVQCRAQQSIRHTRNPTYAPPHTPGITHQETKRSHMRATSVLVRSARSQRWPRGRQAEVVVAATNTARGRSAGATVSPAAPVSSSTISSTCSTASRDGDGGAGDVTKKFGDPSFWEAQYSSQCASQEELTPFEWFLPYEGGLREYLLPFLESMPCTRLLHVGCGTSDMGPRLAQEASLPLHVTDIDNSPSAVRLMKQRHAGLENYTASEADVLNLNFPEGSFDAIVDKGTLDALLCRSVEEARETVAEMHRALVKGGAYVQVSAEDPEARLDLLTGCESPKGRGEGKGGRREPWARYFFKELEELGEGAGSTYFMYVMIK